MSVQDLLRRTEHVAPYRSRTAMSMDFLLTLWLVRDYVRGHDLTLDRPKLLMVAGDLLAGSQ